MSDNKMMSIYFIGFFAFLSVLAIFGTDTDSEKEKTKQLELQYKVDSLDAYIKLHTTIDGKKEN